MQAGDFVVSMVSSPGSRQDDVPGKVLGVDRGSDIAWPRSSAIWRPTTTPPAGAQQVPVKQITTGTVCHLEAAMVDAALEGWQLGRAGLPVHRERRQSRLPFARSTWARNCGWCCSR